jgi:hypothetical protein
LQNPRFPDGIVYGDGSIRTAPKSLFFSTLWIDRLEKRGLVDHEGGLSNTVAPDWPQLMAQLEDLARVAELAGNLHG